MNELLGIVQDLRLYIAQEYPDLIIREKVVVKAPPSPPPAPMPVRPKPAPPTPPPPVVKETPKELPKAPVEPIMQALNRPFLKPLRAPLLDVVERFSTLGIRQQELPVEPARAKNFEITFVSFFLPGSSEEQFIKKVVASVNERLISARLYIQPGIDSAAALYSLAASHTSRAIILTYSQEEAARVAGFLAYFGEELHSASVQKAKLTSQHALFDVSLYDLILTSEQCSDTAIKRALWSDLQQLV